MDANNTKAGQDAGATPSQAQGSDRRDVLEKFGKFAVYAAPFTVLAFAKKADAATSTGPGKHGGGLVPRG